MSELGPTITKLEPTITEHEPTATERLRALLDERGVEWKDLSDKNEQYTEWVPKLLVKRHSYVGRVGFFESTWQKQSDMAKGLVLFGNKNHRHCIYDLTPEQAIAATLGDTDATGARQRDAVEVVRCRDCKSSKQTAYGMMCHHFSMSSGAGWPVEPDGFCAWGKRKESE